MAYICIYINNTPAPFSATPRGASLKHRLPLIVNQKNPGPALMAQPCPAVIDRLSITDTQLQDTLHLSPFCKIAKQFCKISATKSFFCVLVYLPMSFALGSWLAMMIFALLTLPPLLPDLSSWYFWVYPRPCFNSMIDLTAFLPDHPACVVR